MKQKDIKNERNDSITKYVKKARQFCKTYWENNQQKQKWGNTMEELMNEESK